jgi:fatty acid desaturase
MDEKIEWYRTPIPKERLKELTRRKNLLPLIHICANLLFCAATGYFVFYAFQSLSWPFVVAGIYIHGTFFNFLGIFTGIHELSHRTVFKWRGLGEAIYFLLGILTWNNIYKFRASHTKHHLATCHSGRDLEVVLPEKFRPIDWLFCFTITPVTGAGGVPGIYSFVAETVRYAFGKTKGEWDGMLFPEEKKKERRRVFNYARLTLVVHAALAVYFIISGMWILLFVVTIGSFIAPWLAILCALPQHMGLKGDTPDWRVCTRTIKLSPFLRFFYWNMNFHVEHHMYASVPYYNLPKLRKEIGHDIPEARKGLMRVWRELIPIIRKQRSDPSFSVVPELHSR